MTPRQFEELVAKHYRSLGYETQITPLSGDYGVDVFATKGSERIAIQAKMYGGTSRKINREMVMALHGAKDYFDCTKAVIVTDGEILSDAKKVADKLKIAVIYLDVKIQTSPDTKKTKSDENTFDVIWEKYIMPLQGKTLTRANGDTNKIVKVDWGGVERITSNGNKSKIKIEIFRQTVNQLFRSGKITREEINLEYSKRASSGIVLILSQVPDFVLTSNPIGLRLKK